MPTAALITLLIVLAGCGTDQRDIPIGLNSKPGLHARFVPRDDGTTRVTIPLLMPFEIRRENQHYRKGFTYGYYLHASNSWIVIHQNGDVSKVGSGYEARHLFDSEENAAQFKAGEEAGALLAASRMHAISEVIFRIAGARSRKIGP